VSQSRQSAHDSCTKRCGQIRLFQSVEPGQPFNQSFPLMSLHGRRAVSKKPKKVPKNIRFRLQQQRKSVARFVFLFSALACGIITTCLSENMYQTLFPERNHRRNVDRLCFSQAMMFHTEASQKQGRPTLLRGYLLAEKGGGY